MIKMSNKEPTIQDIVDSMSPAQLGLLYETLESTLDGEVIDDTKLEYNFNLLKYSIPMRKVTRFLIEKSKEERRKLILHNA